MVLELIGILNSEGASVSFERDISFDDTEFSGIVYRFPRSAHIQGEAVNIGGGVTLSAQVNGSAETVCARCNKPLSVTFSYSFTENVVSGGDADGTEDDKIVIVGSVVDLQEIAFQNFLVQAPMRYLCKPDCKGLCQHCGADRNSESCDCDEKAVDPRLAALDDLFKN